MSLAPGTSLGPYEIVAPLGEGGMGEVYRATDTRLDRVVALKVSKTNFDERFEREARAVAAVSHPHICALYDVGPNYLVMELVEGVPLAGPLPVEQAVEYAAQILDALDAAHKKGITHRDLKPANILVTKHGIKLLDFGLAKQTQGPLGDAAQTMSALTTEGQIVGTLQYMAPEQLQGQPVDSRADLFAFGCVLYELLSGRRAFEGTSPASVIAAILERQPAPLTTHPPLDRVIATCLAKDPNERFQTALDTKRAMQWAMEQPEATAGGPRPQPRLPWAIAAVAAAVAVASVTVPLRPRADAVAPEMRVDIATPSAPFDPHSFALSPDGRHIAYVALENRVERLWVRSLDSASAQLLAGTEGARAPFWFPDSRTVGFWAASVGVNRIDLSGGPPVVMFRNWGRQGVDVGADGFLLFGSLMDGMRRLAMTEEARSPEGAETVARLGVGSVYRPRLLPDGKHFLFFSTANGEPAIYAGSLAGAAPARLTLADSAGEYLPSGGLLWVRQGALVARRFDVSTLSLSGDTVPLAQSVNVSDVTFGGAFSVSSAGLIAWRSASAPKRQLTWFTRAGVPAGILRALEEVKGAKIEFPQLSADGKRVAAVRSTSEGVHLWLADELRSTRLTFDPAVAINQTWSPDGGRMAFSSRGSNKESTRIYVKPTDGSGTETLLLESAERILATGWSPDGRFILYTLVGAGNNADVMALPLHGDRTPIPLVRTAFNERQGEFSPDGKWVVYQSDETGRDEIYVRPFPGPGGVWQISTGGGVSPRWSPDGTELYYLDPERNLMAVPVNVRGAAVAAGTPILLFATKINWSSSRPEYAVGRDGRFLINTEVVESNPAPITLLMNWKAPR